MAFVDGTLGPDDMRRIARALSLSAHVRPQTSVLAVTQSTQDRIDAGALLRWADEGVSLMVIPVMREEPRPTAALGGGECCGR